MSSFNVSLQSTTSLAIGSVWYSTMGDGSVYAVQNLSVRMEDGSRFVLYIYLADGCPTLQLGEPVVIPSRLPAEAVL